MLVCKIMTNLQNTDTCMGDPLYGSACEPKDWGEFDSDIHNDHSDEVAHRNASYDESVQDEVGHMCNHLH
jgi:hypothetical protein